MVNTTMIMMVMMGPPAPPAEYLVFKRGGGGGLPSTTNQPQTDPQHLKIWQNHFKNIEKCILKTKSSKNKTNRSGLKNLKTNRRDQWPLSARERRELCAQDFSRGKILASSKKIFYGNIGNSFKILVSPKYNWSFPKNIGQFKKILVSSFDADFFMSCPYLAQK